MSVPPRNRPPGHSGGARAAFVAEVRRQCAAYRDGAEASACLAAIQAALGRMDRLIAQARRRDGDQP